MNHFFSVSFNPWLGIPAALYFVSAVASLFLKLTFSSFKDWKASTITAGLSFIVCLMLLGAKLMGTIAFSAFSDLSLFMLLMISFVSFIILRFSRNYLFSETRSSYYQFWFLMTVGSAALLVDSNNIIFLFVSWVGVSFCMHQLLIFYPNRYRAILAARKKFLSSRLGDLFLAAGLLLIYFNLHQLQLSTILNHYALSNSTPLFTEKLAAIFFAFAAILKCAQLPFHGWLLQVMEAPTPVSALLHAGVVNIGGFLMIRLAPLMNHVSAAQFILVLVGAFTACSASLVMTTRISIKLMLAWSTCAQMGFMLMECGLGAYDLALLHLLFHSLYKAYSFLRSGDAVFFSISKKMTSTQKRNHPFQYNLFLIGALILVGSILIFYKQYFHIDQLAFPFMVILLSFSLTIISLESITSFFSLEMFQFFTVGTGLTLFYLLFHYVFIDLSTSWLSNYKNQSSSALLMIIIFSSFLALFSSKRFFQKKIAMRSLYAIVYSGFYLDDFLTRVTLSIWPIFFSERRFKQ